MMGYVEGWLTKICAAVLKCTQKKKKPSADRNAYAKQKAKHFLLISEEILLKRLNGLQQNSVVVLQLKQVQ